jgi:hypothetical protein
LQEDSKDWVVDKRSENIKKIEITPFEKKILMLLDSGKKISWLQSQIEDDNSESLQSILNRLEHAGLLFEEKGRYLSLVFAEEPTLTIP